MIIQQSAKVLRVLHEKSKHLIEERLAQINRTPIIVLGNQKTGTSAIAHLIADYGRLSKTIDIPEIWWPVLCDLILGHKSLEQFAKEHKVRFAKDLIKEPNLTFLFPQLSRLCPGASYVFVIRDPRTNIRSILNRMGLPGNMKKLELDKFNVPVNWLHIFNTQMSSVSSVHYIDILSERWNRCADVYLDNKEKMILVQYEDFVADKVGYVSSIAQALKIPQKQDIANKVDIQYQPIGDRNVSWLDFFGEENLKRITDACEERMSRFGYKIEAIATNGR